MFNRLFLGGARASKPSCSFARAGLPGFFGRLFLKEVLSEATSMVLGKLFVGLAFLLYCYYPEEATNFALSGASALNRLLLSKSSLLFWLLLLVGFLFGVRDQLSSPTKSFNRRIIEVVLASIAYFATALAVELDYRELPRSATGSIEVENYSQVVGVLPFLVSLSYAPFYLGIVVATVVALYSAAFKEAGIKGFEGVVKNAFALDWARPSWGYGRRGFYRLA